MENADLHHRLLKSLVSTFHSLIDPKKRQIQTYTRYRGITMEQNLKSPTSNQVFTHFRPAEPWGISLFRLLLYRFLPLISPLHFSATIAKSIILTTTYKHSSMDLIQQNRVAVFPSPDTSPPTWFANLPILKGVPHDETKHSMVAGSGCFGPNGVGRSEGHGARRRFHRALYHRSCGRLCWSDVPPLQVRQTHKGLTLTRASLHRRERLSR